MQDELIKSYMEVLNESNDSAVKGSTLKTGKDAFGDFKEGNDADENVDLDKPEDKKELSADVKKGEPKKLDKSSFQNPFDALYNKIVSENSFDFSTEDENEIEPSLDVDGGNDGLDLDSEFSGGGEGEEDVIDDIEDLDGDVEGDTEFDVNDLVTTLKDVLSKLEQLVDGGDTEELEGSEDGEELFDDSDDSEESSDDSEGEVDSSDDSEEDDENPFKESKNVKKKLVEGVKVTGLKKGVNLKPFKGNIKNLQNKKAEVKNNSPKASKSKAQVPATGKGHDGVPTKLSPTAGHNLMKPSSHTVSGAVKTGKALFDQ